MKLDLMASELEIVMGFAGKIEFDWFAARFLRDHSEALAAALRALRDAPVGVVASLAPYCVEIDFDHRRNVLHGLDRQQQVRLVPLDTTAGVG